MQTEEFVKAFDSCEAMSSMLKAHSYEDIFNTVSELGNVAPEALERHPMGGYSKGMTSGAEPEWMERSFAIAAGIPADGTRGHGACVQMLELLQRDIPAVAGQGDAALKIRLLAEKERLLNRLIRESEGLLREKKT